MAKSKPRSGQNQPKKSQPSQKQPQLVKPEAVQPVKSPAPQAQPALPVQQPAPQAQPALPVQQPVAPAQKVQQPAAPDEKFQQQPQLQPVQNQALPAKPTSAGTLQTSGLRLPAWPTSKPGPRATPPPPGMRSINPLRREQVAEIGYNQASGEPSTESPFRTFPDATTTGPTSFDQPTAQDILGKRKKRL